MGSILYESMERVLITEENIDDMRQRIMPCDQRAEVAIGRTLTHYRHADLNSPATHVTIVHTTGRAGWCTGGDSSWGEWDDEQQTITPDDEDRPILNRYAEPLEDESPNDQAELPGRR